MYFQLQNLSYTVFFILTLQLLYVNISCTKYKGCIIHVTDGTTWRFATDGRTAAPLAAGFAVTDRSGSYRSITVFSCTSSPMGFSRTKVSR